MTDMSSLQKSRSGVRLRRVIAILILFCLQSLISSFASQTPSTVSVDPDLAFAHVQKLVSFGARPPGSPGIALAQSYIISHLKKLNLAVEQQDFLADTPNGSVPMKNIVAKRDSRQRRLHCPGQSLRHLAHAQRPLRGGQRWGIEHWIVDGIGPRYFAAKASHSNLVCVL